MIELNLTLKETVKLYELLESTVDKLKITDNEIDSLISIMTKVVTQLETQKPN